ncbi:MAG: glycosyltransferase [Notoacmeibacter sp.]
MTNVTAMGPTVLAKSLLPPMLSQQRDPVSKVYLPPNQDLIAALVHNDSLFETYDRLLPNSLSRTLEVTLLTSRFKSNERCLVLGDIPLANVRRQTLFLHNPFFTDSNRGYPLKHRFLAKVRQRLFAQNGKYVSSFIVQTKRLAHDLSSWYGIESEKIKVIQQPCPEWLLPEIEKGSLKSRALTAAKLNLFYPARFYPHKNHSLLASMPHLTGLTDIVSTIRFTIDKAINPNPRLDMLKCIGELGPDDIIRNYRECDALLFLSKAESYGLPLIEAMFLGLPIICADRPYAKELCGDQAFYFDPDSTKDLERAIRQLHSRLTQGWRPDWRPQIVQIPSSWAKVADRFLDVMLENS